VNLAQNRPAIPANKKKQKQNLTQLTACGNNCAIERNGRMHRTDGRTVLQQQTRSLRVGQAAYRRVEMPVRGERRRKVTAHCLQTSTVVLIELLLDTASCHGPLLGIRRRRKESNITGRMGEIKAGTARGNCSPATRENVKT